MARHASQRWPAVLTLLLRERPSSDEHLLGPSSHLKQYDATCRGGKLTWALTKGHICTQIHTTRGSELGKKFESHAGFRDQPEWGGKKR